MTSSTAANRYIQETQPFKLAKTDLAACHAVLVNLAEWLRVTAILIKPFLPRTAETFYRAFNFEGTKAWDQVSYSDVTEPLLPRDLVVTAPLPPASRHRSFPRSNFVRTARARQHVPLRWSARQWCRRLCGHGKATPHGSRRASQSPGRPGA